jgi:hypothetical protein
MDPLVSPCNSIIISLNDICSDDKTEPFPGFIVTLYTKIIGINRKYFVYKELSLGMDECCYGCRIITYGISAVVIASLISIWINDLYAFIIGWRVETELPLLLVVDVDVHCFPDLSWAMGIMSCEVVVDDGIPPD